MAAYRHFIPLSYRLRPRLTPYSSINTLIYNSRFLSRLAEDKELSNLALFKEDHRKSIERYCIIIIIAKFTQLSMQAISSNKISFLLSVLGTPSKVLQALTPTVVMESKHAELLNDYILDLHLLPVDDKDARDFKNARKAGEDAADYVIEHCRKYLPLREMKPYNTNLLSKRSRNRIGFNVFGLKRCIRDGDVYKARKIYRGITRKGREIPLAAQNELLELYALKGIGVTNKAPDFVSVMDQIQERMDDDTKSEEKKNENDVEEQMQASTEDNVQSTDEKKEDSFMDGLAKRLANMHTDAKSASPVAWSKSNMAEVFFSRMKEKDGISYSAMILGTLKVGTTAAYNALLQSIVYEIIPPKRWFSAEQLVHHMQDEPAVSPDLGKYEVINIYNIAKIGSPFEPIKDEGNGNCKRDENYRHR
ncbi:hypothetical protein TrispH2_005299 [Trichoplax sp. H2]|nr:hypothetical protein TrispH2_005299 [Trichoplax sp. H2]|eukprot:RDD42210.1 hypothetical protein TrispH2_005299 [Trichoplax sp. H2]